MATHDRDRAGRSQRRVLGNGHGAVARGCAAVAWLPRSHAVVPRSSPEHRWDLATKERGQRVMLNFIPDPPAHLEQAPTFNWAEAIAKADNPFIPCMTRYHRAPIAFVREVLGAE